MLGHRSIKTTQIYAKVSTKKISEDTKDFFQKFLYKYDILSQEMGIKQQVQFAGRLDYMI